MGALWTKAELGVYKVTNKEIIEIAMEQSAVDLNCHADDFLKDNHVVVDYKKNALTKRFYNEQIARILASYGSNIVVSRYCDRVHKQV